MQKTALAGLRNSYFGFARNCSLFRFLNLATVPLIAILFWTESVAQDLRPLNPGSTTITFIHVNELHAHLTPHWDVVPDAPSGETSDRTKIVERGGLARLATMVKRIRADNPNSILMNIGDTYHGGVEAFYTKAVELLHRPKG